MDLYDIVKKLAGPITATGESHIDRNRFENLKAITELTSKLLDGITIAAIDANRDEDSMHQIGGMAAEFLDQIREELSTPIED